MTTQEELKLLRIAKLSDAVMPMLSTVDYRDSSADCWIECVDNHGDTVRIIPNQVGWQDNRREILVMNTASGVNQQLFFSVDGSDIVPHDITRHDRAAYQVMAAIPAAVLRWAVMRAK